MNSEIASLVVFFFLRVELQIYEGSKNFETFPTKNFEPVAQNVMAQDLMPKSLDIRSLAIKNLSCRVKIFSWKCQKILGTFIYVGI